MTLRALYAGSAPRAQFRLLADMAERDKAAHLLRWLRDERATEPLEWETLDRAFEDYCVRRAVDLDPDIFP